MKEEEGPGGIFAQAKKAGIDMQALGESLALRKDELLAEIKASGLPTPETRSMQGAEVVHGQPFE